MKNHIVNINRDITLFHLKINLNENISLYKMLSEIYSVHVVAKSTTERGNSNNEPLANSSTPFNRAFFLFVAHAHLKKKRSRKMGSVAFSQW